MKAVSLGHQYLSVKTYNENNIYFSPGGIRRSRKFERTHPKQQSSTSSTGPPVPASDPLSRRSSAIQKQSELTVPSVAFVRRSYSDSNDLCYVYQQPSINTQFRHTDGNYKPYSLKSLTSKRHGKQAEDEKLSSRVRRFYKKQDALIDSFKKLDEQTSFESKKEGTHLNQQKRHTEWLIKATLIFNVTLLIAKIIAAVYSRSLSIISSVIDSAVDSASACLLCWVVYVIKHRDPYTYPGGRTRLEPIIIVILSVIMVSASVQVIYESVESLVNDINHFTKNSTDLRHIDMGPAPITVMGVTIVCKAVLSFLCYQISNPTMYAVAQDHRNDVFSNIIALVCGIIASKALNGSIKVQEIVVIDPIGAILISLYIIFCWLKQLREQVRNLSGYKAEPEFLQKITWLTLQHSPLIQKIDTVRAFHFGTSFLVEVEVILPETMSLKEAHDIGDGLKNKLENIPEIERAFVHLDYVVDPLEY
ncbi:unnamed protein product [Rotaria sordida]|uniref:Cation efflux protein cytoplasmic domain-containing protein n=1 Tax=Rotaria sordida TaxID=392033 RepID=A0A815I9L2_9BILA|nr:unnamed protein product [Rotaria sordida]CAF1360847.1 unnamed protein product [Rotaria sordida]CAF1606585.1 unnamed protein product [Rotaria sordida]CAF1606611.1 unnamed protein product [Rotaria sordida]